MMLTSYQSTFIILALIVYLTFDINGGYGVNIDEPCPSCLTHMKKFAGKKMKSQWLKKGSADSAMMCAALCARNPLCDGSSYMASTRTCIVQTPPPGSYEAAIQYTANVQWTSIMLAPEEPDAGIEMRKRREANKQQQRLSDVTTMTYDGYQ